MGGDLVAQLRPNARDAGLAHDVDLVLPALQVVPADRADLAEGVAVEALLDQHLLAVACACGNSVPAWYLVSWLHSTVPFCIAKSSATFLPSSSAMLLRRSGLALKPTEVGVTA